MKKFYLIAMAVSAVSLWACSKNEPTVNPYADAPWAIDETLPVPIQFGKSSSFEIDTKAAPINEENFASAKLKITAVDFSKNIVNTTSAGFLFYDAPATVTTEGLNTWIQFLDSDSNPISRYYPQVSKAEDRMNYTFIGYQIPDEEIYDPVEAHPPVVRAFYLLPNKSTAGVDRNVDILWAKAEAVPFTYENVEYQGFNAQYIRKARLADKLAEKRPSFTFEHKAALAHFVVRGENLPDATDETYTYTDAQGTHPIFTVKDLKVAVRKENANLNLQTGVLTPYNNVSNNFRLYDSFAGYSSSYEVAVENAASNPTGNEYGTGIFLLPGQRTQGTDDLKIQFTLVNHVEGTQTTFGVTSEIVMPLPYLTDGITTGYQEGKAYTYYITVMSATQIRITASVNEWNSYTGAYTEGEVIIG